MIANSGNTELTTPQMLMIQEGLRQNKVTVDEAMVSFWKAYVDPYVSGGRVELRHMMKYIEQIRTKEKFYTYNDILKMKDNGEATLDQFECLNGEDGREKVTLANGKPVWKKIV